MKLMNVDTGCERGRSIAKVRQEVNKSESAEETAEQIEEELKNEVRYSDEDDVSEEDLIRDELGEDDTEE